MSTRNRYDSTARQYVETESKSAFFKALAHRFAFATLDCVLLCRRGLVRDLGLGNDL